MQVKKIKQRVRRLVTTSVLQQLSIFSARREGAGDGCTPSRFELIPGCDRLQAWRAACTVSSGYFSRDILREYVSACAGS